MNVIERITYEETKPFLLDIHYARRMPSISYAYGMFEDGELIGVCTYGSPASPSLCKGIAGEDNRRNVLELNRLCFKPNFNGNNRASQLVAYSLKQLPSHTFVVSYADWGVASRWICLPSHKLVFFGDNKTKNRQVFRRTF